MKLIKTGVYSGIITALRIVCGFAVNKIVAVFTGPAGVALLGSFNNLVSILLSFSNGAISTGVIKYTAEYAQDEEKSKLLYSTAIKISIICSLFVGILLLIFSPILSTLIFANKIYVLPIRIFGCTIVFFVLNSLLIGILNGRGQIEKFTLVNSCVSIVNLILVCILVYFYNLLGALIATVLIQAIIFFLSLILILKSDWFKLDYFLKPFDIEIAKKLFSFSVMAIVTAITGPFARILIRNKLIASFGNDQTGLWQAIIKISDGFLLVIFASLSIYYLPKFSSLTNNKEIKHEIFRGMKIILPMVMVVCIIVILMRFVIIRVLYTEDFVNMESLFLWQIMGSFLKVAAWLIGYLMIAKAMIKRFVVTEIASNLLFIILSYIFVNYYGIIGATYAFAVNYLAYLLLMIYLFRNILFKRSVLAETY